VNSTALGDGMLPKIKIVWLSSYPRSGNTLLRAVFNQNFGIKSTSVYENDLGSLSALEEYVGHYEKKVLFSQRDGDTAYIKTHGKPQDSNPAIYIVRHGAAACVSFWRFNNRSLDLADIITGKNWLGLSWSQHIEAWHKRPNTLVLRYEDIVQEFPDSLKKIERFVGMPILHESIPSREKMATVGGKWVQPKISWQFDFPEKYYDLFNKINGPMMKKLGYSFSV
jgi:hypothetical protein